MGGDISHRIAADRGSGNTSNVGPLPLPRERLQKFCNKLAQIVFVPVSPDTETLSSRRGEMTDLLYVVESSKPFDETVNAVEQNATQKGFRVLHTHDVAATLAEK